MRQTSASSILWGACAVAAVGVGINLAARMNPVHASPYPAYATRMTPVPEYPPGVVPMPELTPGAINPNVTQANIKTTIGKPGWTATIRPPASYTDKLKVRQLKQWYAIDGDMKLSDYEEDHLVSLETGGNPTDERNLWPSLWHHNVNGYDLGMKTKDRLENRLHLLVMTGKITLIQAQDAQEHDWPAAYRKYVGTWPKYSASK